MLRKSLLLLTILALLLSGSAMAVNVKAPARNLPVHGGSGEFLNPIGVGPSMDRVNLPNSSLDSVGTPYLAGTTYYDFQHNGTSGHMVSVDAEGWVHVVWMNGLNSTNNSRHVFYNVWDPAMQDFIINGSSGTQVNQSTRGGYTCQATQPNGFCFPAFHEIRTQDNPTAHAASAIDFTSRSGGFAAFQPTYLLENNQTLELIWPKIAQDRNGKLHMISTENPRNGILGAPQRIYYSRGIPEYDADGFGLDILWEDVVGTDQFMLLDTVTVISANVACSKTSDRMVIAYSHPRDDLAIDTTQYNNDLVMMVSEDGGLNWGDKINVTNFIPPDYNCLSQDTVECDKDTLRTYCDNAVIFDGEDNIHIGFTTVMLYTLEGTINIVFSDIWHWSEQFNEFTPIVHGAFSLDTTNQFLTWIDPGAWQRYAQRPCFSIDDNTGYMYCAYHQYDSVLVCENGFPQADAWISVSCNNGRTWSQGLNVSTTAGDSVAAPGGALNERAVTIADRISYDNGVGYVNMEYVLDGDGGGAVGEQPEGVTTLNPVVLRRIPVQSIPTRPLKDPFFPVLHVDSTGMPGTVVELDPEECISIAADPHTSLRPGSFQLYQNYPNPFNPTTNIQFDLVRDASVSLKIFNVLGQEVASIYNKQMLTAGVRTVNFDASTLASGVYVYQLQVGDITSSRKMVLMK